jgi:hypothetical protein
MGKSARPFSDSGVGVLREAAFHYAMHLVLDHVLLFKPGQSGQLVAGAGEGPAG